MSAAVAEIPRGAAFYHRMPFGPGDRWTWDLIGDEGRYLGGFKFGGKRVLEIGCANGGLTFWMAGEGAAVTAVDSGPDLDGTPWDVLLAPGDDLETIRSTMLAGAKRMNASWRYARDYYGADAELVLSTVYDIPDSLGTFDVVTLGTILLRLRDPIRALEHATKFARDAIIITEVVPRRIDERALDRPIAFFVPNPARRGRHGGATWWQLSPALLETYLRLKGFTIESRTLGEFRHAAGPRRLFTIVAHRT